MYYWFAGGWHGGPFPRAMSQITSALLAVLSYTTQDLLFVRHCNRRWADASVLPTISQVSWTVFFIRIVGGWVQQGPLGTSAIYWPVVPAPGDYADGEFGGMKIGRGNRSTRRKPAASPLCPAQIPLDQTRAWTRTAVVGSQRLTAWAMARPS
jgi:hypothetical protein